MNNLSILFEDEDLLVIDKPAGITVNRAQTNQGDTIQDILEARMNEWHQVAASNWLPLVPEEYPLEFGEPEEIFKQRLGLAHRLDKPTSGVLVLAKNPGALLNVMWQFRQRQVQKKYICLTHGKFALEKGEVNLPLGRSPKTRLKMGVVAGGRPAVTEYEVVSFWPHIDASQVVTALKAAAPTNQVPTNYRDFIRRAKIYQGFSLVNCWPKTGRTHQIRVHMAALQHPIVADATYVGKKRLSLDTAWCERLFLHASEIKFIHPRTKEEITIAAALPFDLQQALQVLIQ